MNDHAIARLRAKFDDYSSRADLMHRLGFHASGVALAERAFAVQRQLWALGVAA